MQRTDRPRMVERRGCLDTSISFCPRLKVDFFPYSYVVAVISRNSLHRLAVASTINSAEQAYCKLICEACRDNVRRQAVTHTRHRVNLGTASAGNKTCVFVVVHYHVFQCITAVFVLVGAVELRVLQSHAALLLLLVVEAGCLPQRHLPPMKGKRRHVGARPRWWTRGSAWFYVCHRQCDRRLSH